MQTADIVWLMDRQQGVAIGTPQELAKQGVLGRYVERPQVLFDSDSLTIRIKTSESL